jgi:glycosyltransferase involved in cell wall biosynthesis
MQNKIFSIIIACKNSEKTIHDTLKSLKNQKYNNFEVIIVDSSNTFQTINIIKMYNLNPKIIRVFNISLYEALNIGVKNSVGKYIYFLHSDDSLCSSQVLLKVFNQIGNNEALYGNIKIINHKKKIIRIWRDNFIFRRSYKYGWHPPHTALFMKRKLFKTYGLFNTKYSISSDYELMLRYFFIKKFRIKYCDFFINIMKAGGVSSRSFAAIVKSNMECYHILKSYNLKLNFFTVVLKIILKISQLSYYRYIINYLPINKIK